MHTTPTPKAMGKQMAELLQGVQSGLYLPDLFGDIPCASCSNSGAHYHPMHVDSCYSFLTPFQAIVSFYATRQGMVLTCTVAVFMLT